MNNKNKKNKNKISSEEDNAEQFQRTCFPGLQWKALEGNNASLSVEEDYDAGPD